MNILFVDATSSGNALALRAHKMGHCIYHLLSVEEQNNNLDAAQKEMYAKYIESSAPYTQTFRATSLDAVELLEEFKKLDIAAVIPGTETGVFTAENIAHELGLPTNDLALQPARRNKYDMQKALKGAHLRSIPATIISSEEEALAFYEKHGGLPVVIKPVAGAGGENTVMCESAENIKDVLQTLFKTQNFYGASNEHMLIETFIDGDEYVVNTVSRNGQHVITDVWLYNKIPSYDKGIKRMLYDTTYLEQTCPQQLKEYVFDLLDAVGIRQGAAHAEVMVACDNDPVLIEVGARAMGKIPTFHAVEKALGYNPCDKIIDSYVDADAFDIFAKRSYKPVRECVHKAFISPYGGKLKRLGAPDFLKQLPTVCDIDFSLLEQQGYLAKTEDLITIPGECTLLSSEKDKIIEDYKRIRFFETRYPEVLYEVEGQCESQSPMKEKALSCIAKGKAIEEVESSYFPTFTSHPIDCVTLIAHFETYAKNHEEQLAYIWNQVESERTEGVYRLTYEELYQQSKRAAQVLLTAGYKRNDVVCLYAKDCIALQVLMFACLQAGLIFHLIDSSAPKNVVKKSYEATCAVALICERADFPKFADTSFFLVDLQQLRDGHFYIEQHGKITRLSDKTQDVSQTRAQSKIYFQQLGVAAQEETSQFLCLLQTSGSTGEPKIIPQTLAALNNIAYGQPLLDKKFGCTPEKSVQGVFFKETFVGFCILLYNVSYGTTIVFLNPAEAMDPQCIAERIKQFNISEISIPPAILGAFTESIDTSTLMRIYTGGDKSLIRKMLACPLMEAWGMTETFGPIANNVIEKPSDAGRIGYLMPNTQIYAVNDEGRLANPGEEGELWVSSITLAPAYWRSLKQTKEAFIENPFYCNWCMPSYLKRLYKTGDYACIEEREREGGGHLSFGEKRCAGAN